MPVETPGMDSSHYGKASQPLLQACQTLDYRALTSHLKSATKEQVSGADSAGSTALHVLASSSASAAAPPQQHASCGCFGGGGAGTPLSDPISAMAQALLSAGASPDARDGAGCTPLMAACTSGRAALVEELLPCSSMQITNSKGETALLVALRGALPDAALLSVVQRMVKGGAAVNHAAADGQTALMVAAGRGRLKIVQLLLEAGASVNVRDAQERTALAAAVAGKHTAVASALLEVGAFDTSPAVVNQRLGKAGQSQLHLACAAGDAVRVQALLAAKAIVSASDDNGLRPLHVCTEPQCALLLIERAAEVNAMDKSNNTPLHLAARKGLPALVRVLLANEAKPTLHNMLGATALHCALDGLCKTAEYKSTKACVEICTLLLDSGADANAQDTGGYQPLDRAHTISTTDIITPAAAEITELLKSHGARLSLTWQCEVDVLPNGIIVKLAAAAAHTSHSSGGPVAALKNPLTKLSMKSASGKFTKSRSMGSGSINKVFPHSPSMNGGTTRSDSRGHKFSILMGRGRAADPMPSPLAGVSSARTVAPPSPLSSPQPQAPNTSPQLALPPLSPRGPPAVVLLPPLPSHELPQFTPGRGVVPRTSSFGDGPPPPVEAHLVAESIRDG